MSPPIKDRVLGLTTKLCHNRELMPKGYSSLMLFTVGLSGPCFYARKQLLLSARLSHRNSVRPSVCHTGGSVKYGAS